MSSHTPGLWTVRTMPDGRMCVLPESNLAVADCCDMADARLIAAAPDLLEALRGLTAKVTNEVGFSDTWEAVAVAYAALEKAGA
jgi:hypothetical protein